MTSLSPYYMVTTMGVHSDILLRNCNHRKIEKKPKTSTNTGVEPNRLVAQTENIDSFKLLAIMPLGEPTSFVSALLNFTTGYVIIRRFTCDPHSVAIARFHTSTRFCLSHDQNWCIDINNEFSVPKTFLDELYTRL